MLERLQAKYAAFKFQNKRHLNFTLDLSAKTREPKLPKILTTEPKTSVPKILTTEPKTSVPNFKLQNIINTESKTQ